LEDLSALGFTLPTPAYLVGMLVFGLIGIAAYRYGKKTSQPKQKWIGVALMLYPYAVSETWLMYVVGGALCAGLYWFHERNN
jgi:uncharacterized membrane protein